MKVEKNKIKLKTSDWKFKIRNEGRRMKIYIKLNQAESGQWTSIKGAVIGKEGAGNMSDAEFAKIMMFRGLNSFMDDVNKAVDSMTEDEKSEALKAAGVEEEVEVVVPDLSKVDENTKDTDS